MQITFLKDLQIQKTVLEGLYPVIGGESSEITRVACHALAEWAATDMVLKLLQQDTTSCHTYFNSATGSVQWQLSHIISCGIAGHS